MFYFFYPVFLMARAIRVSKEDRTLAPGVSTFRYNAQSRLASLYTLQSMCRCTLVRLQAIGRAAADLSSAGFF